MLTSRRVSVHLLGAGVAVYCSSALCGLAVDLDVFSFWGSPEEPATSTFDRAIVSTVSQASTDEAWGLEHVPGHRLGDLTRYFPHTGTATSGGFVATVVAVRGGFPFRSVCCTLQEQPTGRPIVSGGLVAEAAGLRVLPFRPIWPGLVGNSALVAATSLAFAEMAKFAVRTRRADKGRCSRCAHPLCGVRCQECGYSPVERSA